MRNAAHFETYKIGRHLIFPRVAQVGHCGAGECRLSGSGNSCLDAGQGIRSASSAANPRARRTAETIKGTSSDDSFFSLADRIACRTTPTTISNAASLEIDASRLFPMAQRKSSSSRAGVRCPQRPQASRPGDAGELPTSLGVREISAAGAADDPSLPFRSGPRLAAEVFALTAH
jgi:hypothetical protein